MISYCLRIESLPFLNDFTTQVFIVRCGSNKCPHNLEFVHYHYDGYRYLHSLTRKHTFDHIYSECAIRLACATNVWGVFWGVSFSYSRTLNWNYWKQCARVFLAAKSSCANYCVCYVVHEIMCKVTRLDTGTRSDTKTVRQVCGIENCSVNLIHIEITHVNQFVLSIGLRLNISSVIVRINRNIVSNATVYFNMCHNSVLSLCAVFLWRRKFKMPIICDISQNNTVIILHKIIGFYCCCS